MQTCLLFYLSILMINETHLKNWIEETFDELTGHLASYVEIPSVATPSDGDYPFGIQCYRMLSFIEKLAQSYELKTSCFDRQVVTAIKSGSKGSHVIGIACHGDVVPALGRWERDPFTLWQKGQWLVGRGSTDNKGATLVALWALRYLQEQQIPITSDIMLLVGSAEEIGMADMRHWASHHKRPDFTLVPDAGFPLCYGEKGRIALNLTHTLGKTNLCLFKSDNFANSVAAHAQAHLEVEAEGESLLHALSSVKHIKAYSKDSRTVVVESFGLARHSAFPEEGRDAIGILAQALLHTKAVSGEQAIQLLTFIANSTEDFYGTGLGISCEDDISGKLTAVLTNIESEEGELSISFDIRYPVTIEGNSLIKRLEAMLANKNFTEVGIAHSPKSLAEITPLFDTLTTIANSVHGTNDQPYTMGGGTYARILQPAVAYGLGTPSLPNDPPFPPGEGRAHQANESVFIPRLKKGIEIYVKALIAIDRYLQGET